MVAGTERMPPSTTTTRDSSSTLFAVPGPTPGTAVVLLPDLLGRVQVNVGSLTDGLPLGTVLQLVDIEGLTGPLCTARGVSCIGIDTTALTRAVTRLLGGNLVASLLDLDVGGALATLRALLGAGDLTSVVQVQRVSDTVFRLVPVGPLAGLSGLLGSVVVVRQAPVYRASAQIQIEPPRFDAVLASLVADHEVGHLDPVPEQYVADRLTRLRNKGLVDKVLIDPNLPPAAEGEADYMELVEFVRAGAQLSFDELARAGADAAG